MILFKKRDEEVYLISNFKVMFTTLSSQDNLIRIYPNKKLYIRAVMSWFSSHSRFYLAVRNPFDRTESFYKSKFIKAEENRLYIIKNNIKRKWQPCVEHFFRYFDLDTKADPKEVSKKLKSIKFEEVISILPDVFMKDGHMTPQYFAQKLTIKKYGLGFKVPIRFEKIFKIENKEDLKEMSEIFNINLSIKRNNTENIYDDIRWDTNSIKIIEGLYEKDIKYFKYLKMSNRTNN